MVVQHLVGVPALAADDVGNTGGVDHIGIGFCRGQTSRCHGCGDGHHAITLELEQQVVGDGAEIELVKRRRRRGGWRGGRRRRIDGERVNQGRGCRLGDEIAPVVVEGVDVGTGAARHLLDERSVYYLVGDTGFLCDLNTLVAHRRCAAINKLGRIDDDLEVLGYMPEVEVVAGATVGGLRDHIGTPGSVKHIEIIAGATGQGLHTSTGQQKVVTRATLGHDAGQVTDIDLLCTGTGLDAGDVGGREPFQLADARQRDGAGIAQGYRCRAADCCWAVGKQQIEPAGVAGVFLQGAERGAFAHDYIDAIGSVGRSGLADDNGFEHGAVKHHGHRPDAVGAGKGIGAVFAHRQLQVCDGRHIQAAQADLVQHELQLLVGTLACDDGRHTIGTGHEHVVGNGGGICVRALNLDVDMCSAAHLGQRHHQITGDGREIERGDGGDLGRQVNCWLAEVSQRRLHHHTVHGLQQVGKQRRRGGEERAAVDHTGAVFQQPVATQCDAAGEVDGCGHIQPGEFGQILHKTDTRLPVGHVAAIQQQITSGSYRLAPVFETAGDRVEPRAVECGAAQADRAALAVAEDMHRSQVLERRQHLRYLLDTVPCLVQHDHQSVRRALQGWTRALDGAGLHGGGWQHGCGRGRQRRKISQQRLVILYAGVDDHDLPRRRLRRHKGGQRQLRGLGREHTGMQRAGNPGRLFLDEGVAALAGDGGQRAVDADAAGTTCRADGDRAVGMGDITQVVLQGRKIQQVGALPAGLYDHRHTSQCLEHKVVVTGTTDQLDHVAGQRMVGAITHTHPAVGQDIELQRGLHGAEVEGQRRVAAVPGGIDVAPAVLQPQHPWCLQLHGQAARVVAKFERRRQHLLALPRRRRNDRNLGRQHDTRLQRLEQRLATRSARRRFRAKRRADGAGDGPPIEVQHAPAPGRLQPVCRPPVSVSAH